MSNANIDSDRAWFIAQRWQEYRAEQRANLLRTVAIGIFYVIHLWSYFSAAGRLPRLGSFLSFLQIANVGSVDKEFHITVTLLAVTWSMLCLGVWLCLQQQIFPRWLPFFTTSWDLLLLTTLICLGSGPRSPLVAVYFLILAMAALRFSLPLVRFATIGAVLGYVVALGYAKWPEMFGREAIDLRVPRFHQLIVLLAIVLAGVTLGQLVRRARQVAEEYASKAPNP